MPDEKRSLSRELQHIEPGVFRFRDIGFEPYLDETIKVETDYGTLMRVGRSTARWYDGTPIGPLPGGPHADVTLDMSDCWPVRVGDVVRILDTMGHARPIPGHVVDINGGFLTVASILGRRATFYATSGYMIGSYQWQLEPYSKVPFDG